MSLNGIKLLELRCLAGCCESLGGTSQKPTESSDSFVNLNRNAKSDAHPAHKTEPFCDYPKFPPKLLAQTFGPKDNRHSPVKSNGFK